MLAMADDATAIGEHDKGLMKFAFKKKEALATGVRRIVAEQLKIATDQTSSPKVSATAIHSARKAIKRARAALQLANGNLDVVGKETDRILRDAARSLAPSRDAHVQWRAFKTLGICTDTGLCRVMEQRLRDIQHDSAIPNDQQIDAFNRAIRKAQKQFTRHRLDAFDGKQLARALKQTYRRARKCYKRTREAPTGKKLHEWRKAAKMFWHHIQLTDGLTGHRLKTLAKNLHKLTQHLGDDHDYFLLLTALADSTDVDSRFVKRELRTMRATLQKQSFKLARKTFGLAPSAFHERISRDLNQLNNDHA